MFNFHKKAHTTAPENTLTPINDLPKVRNEANHDSAIFRLSDQIKINFDDLLKQEGTMTYGLKELSDGNLNTVNGIQTISNNIAKLNNQNNNLATEIDQMASQLKVTNHHIDDSTTTFNSTSQNIALLMATLQQFSETMIALRSEFNQIASKVSTINEIAENTSLLALNASIEASKAGEAGRGFAIVANETTSLSDDTKFFSKEILNSMDNLNNLVIKLEKQVTESNSVIDQTNDMVEKSKTDLTGIASAEEIVAAKMQDVLAIQNNNGTTLNEINTHIDTIVTRSTNEHNSLNNLIATIDTKATNYQTISNHLEQLSRLTTDK